MRSQMRAPVPRNNKKRIAGKEEAAGRLERQ